MPTVAIHSTGGSAFADGVRRALRALHVNEVAGDADVTWIDGGDSDAGTILGAARRHSRPVVFASRVETCARITDAGVAACCVSEDDIRDYPERRMAKILSRIARGFDPPKTSPINRPMDAMVEVVRACNLRCPLCPVGNGAAAHYENMPVARFRDIASVLGETVGSITLYNYGEPLLHPHIDEIVAIAKAAPIEHVSITTNGTILRPGLELALVDAGLDALRISIDGATQETYAKYRIGGDLETVWSHVRRFAAAKRQRNSNTPRIEAQFIVNRWNEGEIDAFRRLAAEAGVDRVRLKTFNALMSGIAHGDEGRAFLPTDPRYSRYADAISLAHRDRYKLARCEWPRTRIVVNADATIVPCCYDYNGRHALGTFGRDEWWSTPQRAQFRERLERDPMSIDMCSICPVGVPSLDVATEIE